MKRTKKLFSLFLCLTIISSCFNVFGAKKNEDDGKYIKQEIPAGWKVLAKNNYDDDKTDTVFDLIGGDTSVEKLDAEHGRSLRIGEKAGHKFLGKYFKTPLEDGRYCFKFSIYCEDFNNLKLIRLYHENSSSLSDSGNSSMIFTMNGGSYNLRRDSDWTTDYTINGSYELNKWYDMELWLDTINKDVIYNVNGEEFVHMKYNYNTGKIKGFALIQEQSAVSDKGVYVDNLLFIKEDNTISKGFGTVFVDAIPPEGTVGNNFYNHATPMFNITYANRLNSSKDVSIDYDVTDEKGTTIWKSSDSFKLNAEESVIKPVKIDIKQYGIHNLKITTKIGEEVFVKNVKFSFSNSSINNPRNYKAGACSHISRGPIRGTMEAIAPLMANGGFGVLRGEEFAWGGTERTKGQYSFSEGMEKHLETLRKYDLKYILPVNSSCTYYLKPTDLHYWPPSSEEGYKGLENYSRFMGQKMGDTLMGLEVGNEYHNSGFAGPYAKDWDVFANLHRAIYKGLKEGNPNADCYAFDEDPWGYHESKSIQGVLGVLNGEPVIGALSLHPYQLSNEDPIENNERLDAQIDGTLALLDQYGYDKNMPMVFSEFGWPDSLFKYDAQKRAAYIIRGMAYYFAKYPNLKCMCNYNICNYPDVWSSGGGMSEGTFGLVEAATVSGTEVPYLAKPLYCAFAYWNTLMATATHDSEVEGMDTKKEVGHIFKEENGNKFIVLANIEANNKNIGLDLGVESVKMADIYGNEEELHSIDGVFSLTLLKNRVIYIRGNFDHAKVVEPKININSTDFNVPVSGTLKAVATAPSSFKGTFECEKFDVLESVESGEFKNGTATLNMKALNEEKSGAVRFDIKDGNKLYYKSEANITYSPSGRASNIRIENKYGDPTNWDVVFDVENIRNDYHITGDVINSSGEKIYKMPNFECGEKREVRVPFGNLKNIEDIKNIDIGLKFSSGDYEFVKKDFKVCAATYTEKPITIDGVLDKDEWKEDFTTLYLDTPDRIRNIAKYGGVTDLSAKVFLKYDLDNFYMAVDVLDDVNYQPNTAESLWAADGVQFLLGYNLESANATQLSMGKSADKGDIIYRYQHEGDAGGFAGEEAQGIYTHGKCAVNRVGNHTYYEVMVPWDHVKVDGGSVYQGKRMFFAVIVNDNDNDGTGRGWIQLTDAIGNAINTAAVSYEMYLLVPQKKQ